MDQFLIFTATTSFLLLCFANDLMAAGIQACYLCYWQQYIILSVGMVCIAALISEKRKKDFVWALIVLFIISASVSFYHMGVEFKWFNAACPTNLTNLNALPKKLPSCAVVNYRILGMSLSVWDLIYSIFMTGLSVFYLKRVKK